MLIYLINYFYYIKLLHDNIFYIMLYINKMQALTNSFNSEF